MITKFLIGLFSGVGIAYLAYRARTLNRSGGFTAGILGAIVFGLGGVGWAIVLLTFFISSSGLSRLFSQLKNETEANFSKGSRRDAGQVAANGGIAGLLALTYFVVSLANPETPWLNFLWLGFAASLAGANADTWGTELGLLNPHQPISLLTLKRVPKGTSGGVSLIGTLASLAGAGLVAGAAVLCSWLGWAPTAGLPLGLQLMVITISGFMGSMVDSLLGATLQAIYFCPVCQKETERHPVHSCGAETEPKRGWTWLNNDWVNAACTISAGLFAILLMLIIRP
jgi:uncharacterized protein (TIGR00297 family)